MKGIYWLLQQEWTDFDPNHLNLERTPIMIIAFGAEEEANKDPLLDLLIDKGVNIDAQKSTWDKYFFTGDYGFTALHFSMRYICSRPYSCFNPLSPDFSYRTADHLLYRGANPHIADGHGHTPTAMALASGTIAFKFWQHTVHAFKDVQDFVRNELQHPSSLRHAGWDEVSLLRMFNCDFQASSSNSSGRLVDDLDDWDIVTVDRSVEPWWFDLQDLIKAKKNPLPPLPRGWRTSKSNDGSFQYVQTSTGTTTRKRPNEIFFANLRSRKARHMYKEGLIRIQTEGHESGLGDWCSDDSEEYLGFDDGDNYERPWNNTDGESHQGNQVTHQVRNDPKMEDPEQSGEEDEFYDAPITPFAAPRPQLSPFTVPKDDETLRSRIEVYHTAYCTRHEAMYSKGLD